MLFINALRNILQGPLRAVSPRVFRPTYYRQTLAIITPYIAPFRAAPLRCIRAAFAAGVDVGCIYSGGLVFFSRPKRRTCGGRQNSCIFFAFRVIYKYIYIVTRKARRYARFAFASKRTFRTQTEGTGRRVCRRACIRGRAVCCGGVRGVWLPAGRIRPHRQGTPPVGAPCQGTPPFSDFFYFFLKEGENKP